MLGAGVCPRLWAPRKVDKCAQSNHLIGRISCPAIVGRLVAKFGLLADEMIERYGNEVGGQASPQRRGGGSNL